MPEISIVCGLGNPGVQYRNTRHNLGYLTLDYLASRHALKWRRAAGPVMETQWRAGGKSIILIKPLLFMNTSGIALGRHGIVDGRELLVICDDMGLPLGQLRLRGGGGSGGHRGLESVIAALGTEQFPRLRLGIGAPPPGIDWVEYVLTEFEPLERDAVSAMIATAGEAVEAAIRGGLDTAMTRYNRVDPPATSS